MKVAVLGTGFGAYHLQLLAKMDQVEVVVVFGRNPEKLTQLHEEYGVEVTTDIETIWRNPQIEVVDLCLPSSVHREYAVKALRHGKHVFCELPVALSVEDIEAMKQAEADYGRRIMVNQAMLFEPAYVYLQQACRTNTYGKLLSLRLTRETPPLWGKLGLEKLPTDLMIHELDYAVGLLGKPDTYMVWGSETVDQAQGLVKAHWTSGGTLVEITASSQMPEIYPFTVSYEACFEQGKLVFTERDGKAEAWQQLLEYTAEGKRELQLQAAAPYCSESLAYAIERFRDGGASILSLSQAAESMTLALAMRDELLA